jgi:hypothetical protein
MSYANEPVDSCFTEYYSYQNSYYCYIGADATLQIPLPPEYLVDVDPQYAYYYGPVYAYDDRWYFNRHISWPNRFTVFPYDPAYECATYDYLYDGAYYCWSGGS